MPRLHLLFREYLHLHYKLAVYIFSPFSEILERDFLILFYRYIMKQKPVIFLDFDGVLNSEWSYEKYVNLRHFASEHLVIHAWIIKKFCKGEN